MSCSEIYCREMETSPLAQPSTGLTGPGLKNELKLCLQVRFRHERRGEKKKKSTLVNSNDRAKRSISSGFYHLRCPPDLPHYVLVCLEQPFM